MSHALHTGVVVRVATGDEIADAGAVTAQAYVGDGLIAPDDEYVDQLRDAARRARDATLLVAVLPGEGRDGEVVVGTITLVEAGSPYADIARDGEHEVRMLAVAPEARRRHVADALMTTALREAVAAGARRVVLSTQDAMHAARGLYDRLGFDLVPERDWWPRPELVLHARSWTAPEGPGAAREVATWPPQRVVDVDGWRVGLSGGVTRRANSVLVVGRPADVEAAIDKVEAVYADAGQPSVFRVDPAVEPELDGALEARGYLPLAATDVLVRPIAGAPLPADVPVEVADEPDADWLALWSGTKAPLGASSGGVDEDFVRGVLTAAPALYLTVRDDEGPVGVLRAAFVDDWVGISCLVVAPGARRRGLGRALTLRAMREASARGAARAFLQVEAENTAAATLYAGLGFQPSGRYHYRQRG